MPEPRPNRGESKQNYATPAIFVAAVLAKLGIAQFQFDFAAEADTSVATCYWDEAVNSLTQDAESWALQVNSAAEPDGWGWLNPPFDDIAPWAACACATMQAGGKVALLVPAAVGSTWWRASVHDRAEVYFLNGRIPFDLERPHWGYPKDLALCLYNLAFPARYHLWRWIDDVPPAMLAEHKQACTAARLVEKAEKRARLAPLAAEG